MCVDVLVHLSSQALLISYVRVLHVCDSADSLTCSSAAPRD
jgi:hypothetical protein